MEQEEVEACWGTPLFSLLTSQTREGCERVPQHTHTQTHSHTHTPLKDASTRTNADMFNPHRSHARFTPPPSFPRQMRENTHTLIYPPCFFQTHSHSPLQPTAKLTWIHPPPTQAQIQLTKNYSTTNSPFPHFSTHTHIQKRKSSGFNWTQLRTPSNEVPHVLYSLQKVDRLHSDGPYVGMNMHGNLSYRQQGPHIYDAKGHQCEEWNWLSVGHLEM